MTPSTGKSDMITELEAYLKEGHYLWDIQASTLIVDFMSFVRSHTVNQSLYPNFKTLAETLFKLINMQASGQMIHIVFDSYVEKSLKESTRQLRSHSSIEISKVDCATPLPRQMEKFWSSSKNKECFQSFIRSYFSLPYEQSNQELILSGVLINDQQLPAMLIFNQNNDNVAINSLASNIEEADQRLIQHIYWAAKKGKSTFVVISNDTDVLVLLIHYVKKFKNVGVSKIWQKIGLGDKRRFIPIHSLYQRIPKPLKDVLLSCYIETGCDYLSRVGTKLGALRALPEKFLKHFGSKDLDEEQAKLAEEFLVNVLKNNAVERTFDQLRYSQYKKQLDLIDLPPTSHSVIHGHIRRWWFLLRKLSSLLKETDEDALDPTEHGWKNVNGHLLPDKCLLLVPDHLLKNCRCKTEDTSKRCNSKRCTCRNLNVGCTSLCACTEACANSWYQYLK